MIGVFSKDIWGIIFEKIETNFSDFSNLSDFLDFSNLSNNTSHALNNLSLTCKRLYEIDKQRRENYIRLYEKTGPLIATLKKGRQDYVNLVKYASISQLFYKYGYFPINRDLIICWLKHSMNSVERKRLLNMKENEMLVEFVKHIHMDYLQIGESYFSKDIELISAQVNAPRFFHILSWLKNEGDIVNAIMDLQFFD